MNDIIHIIESNFAPNNLYSSNATSTIFQETNLSSSLISTIIKFPFQVIEKNYINEDEDEDVVVKYEYFISDLDSDNWKLNSIVEIAIELRNNGDFIACYYDLDVFGYGNKQQEAIGDLKIALVNQYEFLLKEERKYNLNPLLAKQLNILKNIISKKD